MSLTNSQRLGPYEILSPIGTGGMGEVYKARDTRLGRDVAVKVLPAEFAGDPERLRRFEQEARAAAALNHPSILVLYDIGSSRVSSRGAESVEAVRPSPIQSSRGAEGPAAISPSPPGLPRPQGGLAVTEEPGEPVHYIVTELLEGESLRQRLRGGPIPPAKAVDLGMQIVQGLAAAHEKGIVHRDLKPENLWLTRDGRMKILDFGLAQLRLAVEDSPAQSQAPTSDSPTREGKVLGTPGYMAPEQVRGHAADARSDLFSFGVVLYEMLSGQRAFTGATQTDVMAAILKEDPPSLPRNIPPALAGIVRECIEKRPEDRFSSAHDLALALLAVSGDYQPEALAPTKSGPAHWMGEYRLAGAGVAVALLAATLTGVLLWHPWKGKSTSAGEQSAAVPSLLALPCKVLGSPESAYLTDAVPSTLSTLLGQVQGIETKVPPTSFEVERVRGDLAKIASAYKVQSLIMTTVTAQADSLVLNVQLVEAGTRKVRWSRQYEGSKAGYNDLARQAADGLRQAVLPTATPIDIGTGPTSISGTEMAIQEGKYYTGRYGNSGRQEDFDKAFGAFQRALGMNPKLADAAGYIAGLYAFGMAVGWMPPAKTMQEAQLWIAKALALDPKCSQAWVVKAQLEGWNPDADLEQQIDWTLKGATFGPRNTVAHINLGWMGLWSGGSLVLAVETYREAIRIDPLNLGVYSQLAISLLYLGRPQEALPISDHEVAMVPESWMPQMVRASILADLGRTGEASAILKHLETITPKGGALELWLKYLKCDLAMRAGDDGEARDALKQVMAELENTQRTWNELQTYLNHLPVVARRFGKDAAIDLFVVGAHHEALPAYDWLMLRPELKGVRKDPRAAEAVRQTKAQFDTLVRILQASSARGELPRYLEKPMEDLLKDLRAKGAWP